jgi:hypothetical protein
VDSQSVFALGEYQRMTLPTATRQQKVEELFRRGIIIPWQAHPVQKEMAAAIRGSNKKKYVVNSARRLGKSTLLCMLALEHAFQNPNSQIRYAAETQRSVKKIILPIIRGILSECPKHLRPKFHSHDGVYTFNNGSEIHIAGAALDQADSLRGTACDLAIVDEAGFIDNLDYLIDSVLLPQTMNRPNAKIVMASTPSRSPDHPFVSKYLAQAMADGAYSKYTIYDNPMLTPEIIEEFMREAGGAGSTTWRREYLAEIVTESNNAVFPEAIDGLDALVYDIPRPQFFIPFVAVDLGYVDYTGAVFGYYDFIRAKIVIEDELLFNKSTSATIVQQILSKERELWGDNRPRQRIVDGPALVIADLNETHKFGCRTPEKHDLTANINKTRIDISNQTLVIHPRCTNLISQLKFAVWDTTRTKFARSSAGHFDLAAATLYFVKHIDRSTCPIPPGYGWDSYNDFGFERTRKNSINESLRRMFPMRLPTRKSS